MSGEIQAAPQVQMQFSDHVLTAMDRQLLRQAMTSDRSPKALATSINNLKSPEWCALRLDEILEENNWMALVQEKRLLLYSLREIAEIARGRYLANEKGSGKMVIDTLNLLGRRVDEVNIDIADVEYKMNHGAAQTMIEVLNLLAEHVTKTLEGSIPREQLQGAFAEALPVVVEEVNQRAV